MAFAGKHVLIIVENLPVPFDRRVWNEATELASAGYSVSVICPKTAKYNGSYEKIDSVEIYRHWMPKERDGPFGYLLEYSIALFFECLLALKIYLKRRFHVIHGCNPPDLIFLVALPFKFLGVKYIFDHHDANPELYLAKYDRKDLFYRLMCLLEKLTFKVADFSIATNQSYREIAINRGQMKEKNVYVVRSAPKKNNMKVLPSKNKYKLNRNYLIGYVGVIGEQEGIDLLIDSVALLNKKRSDFTVAIVGSGPAIHKVKAYAKKKNVSSIVKFYGRVGNKKLLEILNTADICVNPDKPTEMNAISTMNKILEYMALQKPIVQFDLKEGKYSAGKSSLYAKNTEDFAEKLDQLLDDKDLREKMGKIGYNRLKYKFNWELQAKKLVEVYSRALSQQ